MWLPINLTIDVSINAYFFEMNSLKSEGGITPRKRGSSSGGASGGMSFNRDCIAMGTTSAIVAGGTDSVDVRLIDASRRLLPGVLTLDRLREYDLLMFGNLSLLLLLSIPFGSFTSARTSPILLEKVLFEAFFACSSAARLSASCFSFSAAAIAARF